MSMLGRWNVDEMKTCNLPQKVQSAFTSVTSDLEGADYQPVLYVGSQVVNGTNYCVLACQTMMTASFEKNLSKLIINVSPDGKATLLSVSRLIL